MRTNWSGAQGTVHLASAILSLSVLLFAPAMQSQAPQPTLESRFQAAMAAQDQGDLEKAKSILIELRRSQPGLFPVDESLGLIYVAQQQYADALPLLQAAVHEQPSSDVAHSNLGADLFKLKRNKEALDEFTTAARLNPKNPMTQQGLGELWLEASKPERAAEAFSAALEMKSNDPDLEMDLATAWVAAGNFDKAQAVLDRVPGKETSADAQVLLGQVSEGKGLSLEAARHFDRAVKLDPSESNVWMLAVEYLRHWTFDSAIPEFKAGVDLFPASARMKLGLGAAYFGDQKYGESIPIFASLLDVDKDNALYAEMLGIACNAVTESAKSGCTSLLAYAEAHPRDAVASTYSASMLLTETANEHRTDEARRLLENALAAAPNFANAQYEMGLLKQGEGDWKGSEVNLERALKNKQDLAQAHYRLALAYWRSGRKQEAEEQMALQKKYAQQEQKDLDRRLHEITVFLVDAKK
jgi:tetratricopeptide (TPR) repeat protein